MRPDTYTKCILTVIALCLVVMAWETVDQAMAPQAQAQVVELEPTAASSLEYCGSKSGFCTAVKIYR